MRRGRPLARRRARVPQPGEIVLIGLGQAVRIRAVPLLQVSAPRFYEITDEGGVRRDVSIGGAGWLDAAYAMKAGTVEATRRGPPPKVIPERKENDDHDSTAYLSALPCGHRRGLRIEQPGRVADLPALPANDDLAANDDSLRSAVPVVGSAADAGTAGAARRPIGYRLDKADRPSPKFLQHVAALVSEIEPPALSGFPRNLALKIAALPPTSSLMDRLDAARDAYDQARLNGGTDDLIWTTFEAYTVLIAEVDRRHPAFYEGRK